MPAPIGRLCFVLHAHVPYVMNHGERPHGTAWLYEAMAEVYLPLLDLIGELALLGVHPGLTIGLTPVLLEQLHHPQTRAGFTNYLDAQQTKAEQIARELDGQGQSTPAGVARDWARWYAARGEHWARIHHDIPGQFAARQAEGHIELLGGPATHPYLPLLRSDASIHAQCAIGAATTRAILGKATTGMWLPECGYRPAAPFWQAPVLHQPPANRPGVETFIARAGWDHFFLDGPQLNHHHFLGSAVDRVAQQIEPARGAAHRAVVERMEPFAVASVAGSPGVNAFARDAQVSEQVWNAQTGYPGDGAYLEFHKKQDGALRLWRVTDISAGVDEKRPYDPDAVAGRIHGHARHFCSVITGHLNDFQKRTGRAGTCVVTFDAELFGHWWFEGPRFLRDVILTLNAQKQVTCATSAQALAAAPKQRPIVRLAEGSWGKGNDSRVWMNEMTRWMWEVEHRAETRFTSALASLPWRQTAALADVLRDAGRELLLMQSSDWPFIVEAKAAHDYGSMRFALHATRFDRAMHIARVLAQGKELTPMQRNELEEMRLHDVVFADLDLIAWVDSSGAS